MTLEVVWLVLYFEGQPSYRVATISARRKEDAKGRGQNAGLSGVSPPFLSGPLH